MSDDRRIEQFKQMSEADPENELGHFSLGKTYLGAGRFAEAIGPLSRALDINKKLSKAYQLLGDAYEGAGRRDDAIEILTRGTAVADEQGDRVPRDAMTDMLKSWGAPVPAVSKTGASPDPTSGTDGASEGFQCTRCRKPTGRLEKAPFKGQLGEKIFNHVCSTCWREWIGMGTKVINEMGLALSTRAGQETYDQYMIEFLQLEDR